MALSQANKEQNQHYAPHIFESHFILVSEVLKDELVKQYPTAQLIVDMFRPYFRFYKAMITNGQLPINVDYRNLLGVGFYITDKETWKPLELDTKGFANPDKPTSDELQAYVAKTQTISKPLDMVTIGEWNYFSDHPYKNPNKIDPKTKMPQYKKAKGCIFEKNFIRVMPEIPFAEVRYVKQTAPFKFGYKMLPDETYVFDPDTTTEELWDFNAIPYLVKGVNLLLANYLRDPAYIASAQDLRENNLF